MRATVAELTFCARKRAAKPIAAQRSGVEPGISGRVHRPDDQVAQADSLRCRALKPGITANADHKAELSRAASLANHVCCICGQ